MKWTYRVGKVRGGVGETDYDKKVIKIDKSKHKNGKRGKRVTRITPNKDGTENIATTIQHELLHKRYPDKGETAIEKLARAMVAKKSKKEKGKLYSKFS